MSKTIVLLLDGTSNQITKRRTHILRLYGTLQKDENQLVYYDPGVGTFGADNAFFTLTRKTTEIIGLATGRGLMTNVREAYEFLMTHYKEGDKLVLCGFSRGAYTARVLAGFLHAVGLIEEHNRNLLTYALRAYTAISETDTDTGKSGSEENPFAAVNMVKRVLDAPRVTIDALLLFDTVSTMIDIDLRYGLRLRKYAFSARNPSVKAVRHALAIDECRSLFRHSLWEKGPYWHGSDQPDPQPGEQDVKEVWFAGVHGDIGGGVPEMQSALGKVVLDWMIDEAKGLDLRFKDETVDAIVKGHGGKYVTPDPLAKPGTSMTLGWKCAEFFPRLKQGPWGKGYRSLFGHYIPREERRVIEDGAHIHSSVFERRGTVHDFDQPNIPRDHHVV
ncbi:MAG: DUF2235 domain-containing protein [Marinovum sp.]|nr:DUF2235 domain-containing protein [Marinovum sp.]